MINDIRLFIVAWGFLFSMAVLAQNEVDAPPAISSDPELSGVEPEVTIVEQDSGIVYEYRIRGQLYMARVVPATGPSYYLLDIDGDGVLDVQGSSRPDLTVPQWSLFRW